jgi:hypothetical protein
MRPLEGFAVGTPQEGGENKSIRVFLGFGRSSPVRS